MSFHFLYTMLGWTAVVLGLISTIAQFRRSSTVGVEGVSLATWFTFVLLGCFWTVYGLSVHSWIIVLGSVSVAPLQLAVVFRLKPWLRWDVTRRCLYFFFLCCVAPTFLWGWAGGVLGVGVAMVANRGPQLIELVRTRDASGVSVAAWSMSVAGSSLWVLYYVGFHLWAACLATCGAGAANMAIALLANWRHRQGRQDVVRDVVFAV